MAHRRKLTPWQRLKKKAPKVPDITCPDIDSVIDRLDKHLNNNTTYTKFRHKQIVRLMERLRDANERLRDSGQYWYEIAKENMHRRK